MSVARIRSLALFFILFGMISFVKAPHAFAGRTCCESPGNDPTKCNACSNDIYWKNQGDDCGTDPSCRTCPADHPVGNACSSGYTGPLCGNYNPNCGPATPGAVCNASGNAGPPYVCIQCMASTNTWQGMGSFQYPNCTNNVCGTLGAPGTPVWRWSIPAGIANGAVIAPGQYYPFFSAPGGTVATIYYLNIDDHSVGVPGSYEFNAQVTGGEIMYQNPRGWPYTYKANTDYTMRIATAQSSGSACTSSVLTLNFTTKVATPTPSPTPAPVANCSLSQLTTNPYPDPIMWNTTDKFIVKNISTTPATFDWLLDRWDKLADSNGTQTLAPGASIVLGMGPICSKWQLDLFCGGKSIGYVIELNQAACNGTVPTPTPTANPSASPTVRPTATPTAKPTATPTAVPTPTPTPKPTATPLASITSHVETDPSLKGGTKPTAIGFLSKYCSSPDTGDAFTFGSVEALNGVAAPYRGSIKGDGTYTISSLPQADGTYTVKFTPSDPNYTCSCPAGCEYHQKSAPTTEDLKFYVTPIGKAWYQTMGGDVAAQVDGGVALGDTIPAGCVEPYCHPFLSLPLGISKNSIGALITMARSVVNFLSGTIAASPDDHSVKLTNALQCNENYLYFYRLYSMGINPSSDFQNPANAVMPAKGSSPSNGKSAYYYSGALPLTIASDWNVQSGDTIVVFVNGDLHVNANITVPTDAFLAFIVSGDIQIGANVGTSNHSSTGPGQVQGVFIANNSIKVLGGGVTEEKKLVAEGTYAACGGIKIDRDYARADVGLDNNTFPGALFIYRPDFVKNAPPRMRTSSYNWREVSP